MTDKTQKQIVEKAQKAVKEAINRLKDNHIKCMRGMVERTDKKLDTKIATASRRVSDQVVAIMSEKLDLIQNIDKLSQDVKSLRRTTEELLEKHIIITEVAYIGRQRLSKDGQAYLNAELIRSMDFPNDWFHRRNDMSLNELFDLYQNGVNLDADE